MIRTVQMSHVLQSHLRREPTPFPKEMRAMAKRMQNLRQTGKEAAVMTSQGGSEYG